MDILQSQSGGQENSREIRFMVRKAGGLNLPKVSRQAEYFRSKISPTESVATVLTRKRNNISSEKRSALLVVAALIITATYQTALSPPGGVWQGNNPAISSTPSPENNTTLLHSPGSVVMAGWFPYLWLSNSFALWVSILFTAILLPTSLYSRLLLSALSLLSVSYTVSITVISETGWLFIPSYLLLGCFGITLPFLQLTGPLQRLEQRMGKNQVLYSAYKVSD